MIDIRLKRVWERERERERERSDRKIRTFFVRLRWKVTTCLHPFVMRARWTLWYIRHAILFVKTIRAARRYDWKTVLCMQRSNLCCIKIIYICYYLITCLHNAHNLNIKCTFSIFFFPPPPPHPMLKYKLRTTSNYGV